MRAKFEPTAITSRDAPSRPSSLGAKTMPTIPRLTAMIAPSATVWTAARAAPSGLCSPIRRAIVAVAPMAKPIASVYTIAIMDSVSPTVAIADSPSFETQKTSATANTLSRMTSSTIGIASRRIARPIGPSV